MVLIHWQAIGTDLITIPAPLGPLLGTVVMGFAKALPVCFVPEEISIATMGSDVINHSRCNP